MFNLAIDSKLRGCDLVSLRVDDIAVGGHVRDRATIIQRKTGRPIQFEITEQTRASLQDWLNARPADRGPYVFPSRVQKSVTARQYARVVHGWIEGAGMDSSAYGTHSMRRTEGGADLPQDRQSASGSVASRNGYIVPTNSRLKLVSATGSTRASAKWCR